MTTVVSLEVAKVVNRMAKNNSTTRINITGGDHRGKTIRGKPRRTLGERDHVSLLKTDIIQREMTNPLQDGQALVFIPQATDVEGHSRNNHGDKYMRVIEHCHIILVKTKILPAPSSAKLPRWGQEQFFLSNWAAKMAAEGTTARLDNCLGRVIKYTAKQLRTVCVFKFCRNNYY